MKEMGHSVAVAVAVAVAAGTLSIASQVGAQAPGRILIRGTYATPRPLWDTGARLDQLGINAIFVHAQSLDAAMMKRARAEGAKVFAEFGTLNASYGLAEHPDAHPIDETGKPAPKASWFMGVCPTHRGFRAARMKALRRLLEAHDVDGVWMDYLHWHAQFEDPYPILVKTCFCDSCLAAFQASSGVNVPEGAVPKKAQWILRHAPSKWEDWRVSVLVDWAREIRALVKSIRPRALVGNYHAAWKDDDFWGARRRCLGLDFQALAPHVDVFSPMPYHERSGMPVTYVADFVRWFSGRLPFSTEPGRYPQLWPIVQASDTPAADFEQALRGALEGKSTGVMMFTLGSVVADPAKLAALKRVYLPLARGPTP
jgi:hypothetical protein